MIKKAASNRIFLIGLMYLILLGLVSTSLWAEDPIFDPNFHIYLLIGQSNMEGQPRPEAIDKVEDPRVRVLAYEDNPRLNRKYNEWSVAVPPLHGRYMGVGPGDYFAKTMIAEMPDDVTIGLVPCGINGVDLDFFRKGVVSQRRDEFRIPPDNHWDGAYEWVITRAKLAQKYGVIKGIIFHQGESDWGPLQPLWIGKLNEMVTDLRTDLDIPDAPILIGELLYGGGSEYHNNFIRRAPQTVENCFVISAKDLKGADQYHFNLEGQRELGKRYAEEMLTQLGY